MAAPKVEPKIYTGISLDFETGGLDCTRSACTQIAMQAVRLDTMEVFDRYVSYISPYEKQELGGIPKRKVLKNKREILDSPSELMDYEPAALSYTAITMDMLYSQGVDMKKVAMDIIAFAKRSALSKGFQAKPILIGQNITFDIGFLQQLMNYAGLMKDFEKVFAGYKDFYGNFQIKYIDTIDLGRLVFAADPEVTSYKLELLSERLGIEMNDAHDADADVCATVDIVRVCVGRLRSGSDGLSQIAAGGKREKTRSHFKI